MKLLISALLLALVPAAALATTQDVTIGVGEPHANRGSFPILQTIELSVNDYCVGVGFDGAYFWVSAGDTATGQCMWYIFDEYGTLVNQMPQGGGATGWGHRDLEWNGQYMFGSYSARINGYSSPAQNDGYFNGPINPNRAIGWDGTYFYTAGFGTNLYRLQWNGQWGSTATATSLSGPYDAAYGLTWDTIGYGPWGPGLWMSTADYSGDIYQFDANGQWVDVFTTLPEYDIHGGCTMANTRFGYVLVVLAQWAPDTLIFYDLGHGQSATEQTSWGAVKALYR